MGMKLALLSVFDKGGIVEFARGLRGMGVEILSTGGTARALREAGVPITEVGDYTGHPEIMDGRVKTLHPKVHGGILALRENAEHTRQAEQHGIRAIDLVCVNLYPFTKVVARPDVKEEEAIENIDIGGPAMVRAAAKNHRYVTIVTDPSDYPRVLEEMRGGSGVTTEEFRRELATKAFVHTARYDAAIAEWMNGAGTFPEVLNLSYQKVLDLRYGENPHQRAAFYRAPRQSAPSVAFARPAIGGKEISYNNLLDLDAAFECVRELQAPAAVVVKHNNPCGAAHAMTMAEAFRRALAGDAVSAYGGIAAFNAPVDPGTAEAVAAKENFFEAVIAPSFDPEALKILRERPKWGKNLRLFEAGALPREVESALVIRSVRDGLLVQTPDDALWTEWRTVGPEPSEIQNQDLRFAWTVCKHVKSNAIVLARNGMVVGVGAGQMSRLDSAKIAVAKAGSRVPGAVAASDAFFPFADGVEVLMEAGVTAIVQPGGSIRDEEVIAAASRRNVPMVFTGMRHFKH
ncbi:MAG: bifunctional phosphoribosylaminoimidazolecarboxamide formyltransferase/IMP cyclohydrolase [Planctomycetes bacterium]|nr:bifunctional phosphoribosylaminoimidazolecarboxamide formyltransferase/IMP cyclohydrolase [Planctomycetota bacterium]